MINQSYGASSCPEILCRLCGRYTTTLKSIYSIKDQQDGFNLAEKINFCLPIIISLLDKSPKYVCSDCERKVNISFNLSIMSLETAQLFPSSGQKNDDITNKIKLKCPVCFDGNIIKTSTPKKTLNTYELKEKLNNTKSLIDNKDDDIKKYNTACPISRVATVLIFDDEKPDKNRDEDIESIMDDTKTITDDDFACSYCSQTICDEESHKCQPKLRKGGKGYYISKRSYACIQEFNPELADNISEDRSDDGRSAKKMKLDTHYENW